MSRTKKAYAFFTTVILKENMNLKELKGPFLS